ncbi:mechanosensitive ion channel family protein [Desulfatitalea alkaliphila]|uniref:Mechanosensitive ion channel family protein n=1 Tax=Desulfatitalea alkaliphila TaxID=2929485 RepID=A0AA41RDI5_9BACT|nr:mechanosensitive ion channel family protein [Desulfatitalea alkaliphila]MCJ8502838.1 mechanosensitive ion channel family protein [Desulfatitalea alkaliphila]
MSTPVENSVAAPPEWLPEILHVTWVFLSDYPIFLSLIVVLTGLLLAAVVRKFILFWGSKLTARTTTDLDEKLLRIVARVAALVVGYIALVAALQVLALGATAEMITIRLMMSMLILQLIRAAMQASNVGLAILGRVRHRFAIIEERTIPLFDLMLTVIIVAIGAYALLQVWNIDPTAWLASAGVVGIAVGFAARDTLANLFAGFFIIADAPYTIGDYIILGSGERGYVVNVGIRSTRIRTRDDVEIIVPNSEMANSKIINESGGIRYRYRIRVEVGVAYGSDLDQVCTLLMQVAADHPEVTKNPAPRVRNRGFGDSSIDFELLGWIRDPADRGRIKHDLFMAIDKAFNRAGVAIPFPQRDIWVKEVPAAGGKQVA